MIKKRINYTVTHSKTNKKNLVVFESIYNRNLWSYLLISKRNEIVNQNFYIDNLKLKIINKEISLQW